VGMVAVLARSVAVLATLVAVLARLVAVLVRCLAVLVRLAIGGRSEEAIFNFLVRFARVHRLNAEEH
jgi:hypothetical protein